MGLCGSPARQGYDPRGGGAERPQEIDVARAQKAKERAEQRLKSNAAEVDYARAEDALRRAETRLDVAKEK